MKIEEIKDENIFGKYFEEVSFFKKDFLTKQGQIENYIYFIKKGIVRLFSYDDKGKEHTFDFISSDNYVNSYKSFKQKSPSEFYVQAITFVEGYKVDRETVKSILRENIALAYMFIEILETLFIQKIDRELLLKNSPQKSYQLLIDKKPYLIKNVPLKYIASYIRVTPQALSRIRKQIY